MKLDEDDPVQILLAHVDYLETMSSCLEQVAIVLRDEGNMHAADAIITAVRNQRLQSMLVRGQLAAW